MVHNYLAFRNFCHAIQAYKAAKFITLPDRPADLAAKSLRHLSAKAGGEYWPSLEKITKILNEMSFFSKSKASHFFYPKQRLLNFFIQNKGL